MDLYDKYLGEKHGKLTILQVWRDYTRKETMCRCLCDCGKIKDTYLHSVRYGRIRSCGCGRGNFRHGKHGCRLYRIWQAMLNRCRNKNAANYKYYGGIGISVCNEWESYPNFEKWALKNGYNDGLTIDRIDENGNYEPSNCRWASMLEQNNLHKRNVYKLNLDGDTVSLKVFCDRVGLSYDMIETRLKRKKISIAEIQEKYGR